MDRNGLGYAHHAPGTRRTFKNEVARDSSRATKASSRRTEASPSDHHHLPYPSRCKPRPPGKHRHVRSILGPVLFSDHHTGASETEDHLPGAVLRHSASFAQGKPRGYHILKVRYMLSISHNMTRSLYHPSLDRDLLPQDNFCQSEFLFLQSVEQIIDNLRLPMIQVT